MSSITVSTRPTCQRRTAPRQGAMPIRTNGCACRNSNTYIQMMESAEKWRRQNATNGMYCSRRRRVLVDRKVRASLVIVGRVRSQQMAEMPLAEHDNVVKTFPPD